MDFFAQIGALWKMTSKKHLLRICNNVAGQANVVRDYLDSVIQQDPSRALIIGFSGGSMPALLAPVLASLPDPVIDRLRLFPVDERLVPLASEDSNAGTLLRLLPEKFGTKMIITDHIEDASMAAKDFECQLRSLNPKCNANGFPVFDLLFLGLGPDGHTCSLFPGHPLLKEDSVWVGPISDSPKPPPRRITVTLPVLNAADNLAFIANGASKAEMIKKIVIDDDQQLPPSQIKPKKPIQWIVDKEAAKEVNITG